MKKFVYRILNYKEWQKFQKDGIYKGNELDKNSGYLHLSNKQQLKKTIDIHFKKKDDLVILKIDIKKLNRNLVWEFSRGGEKFPHLYDELNLDIVTEISLQDV